MYNAWRSGLRVGLRHHNKLVLTPLIPLHSFSKLYSGERDELYPIFPNPPIGQDMTQGQF